ncbi:GDP-L-fucose synthase family protein [Aureliella helgolandensis]|nr:GDP-L-fucose synthase [Aureliella helgolandensis]
MLKYSSIYVAGHRGMVGSAVCRRLQAEPGIRLVTRNRADLDLEDHVRVDDFFRQERPEMVVFAAARVGGIHANNTYPVEFLTENLNAQLATITSAFRHGVKRFLFLGSTCIYPRMANQPITEDQLLTGPLEQTNEAYALAKICGLKLCEYYRRQHGVLFHSAMPTNLYGPGDNYHPQHSHVLPALILRFHSAKQNDVPSVAIWGTGEPRREFLFVDDMADAIVHLLSLENPPDWVNVGSGKDRSILELARLVAKVVGFQGAIETDPSKPDGTPRKLTSIRLLESTGWSPTTDLEDGVRRTYADFLRRIESNSLRSV